MIRQNAKDYSNPFFLCLINKYFTADTAIYKFAASLDSKYLKIYNNEQELKTNYLHEISYSLDFDPDSSLLVGKVKETRAIAFLNKTHFIAGFNGFIVIYDCSNLNSNLKKTDSTKIGQVYDIKIIYENQKILIASHEGFISVYDLSNYNFLQKNQIANKIWAIDAFGQNLIFSQCNQVLDICLYRLDSSSNLIELKRRSGVNEFFTIKIFNENKVVFGGDKFLKIWEISTNQIVITISIDDKALSLDIFSSQIIASGHENDGVKFWNMNNYSNFKTVNTGSKVHYLKNLNGYSAIKNYLNLKSNQHSTQLQNLESTHTAFINMKTTFESTESKVMTSKPSSIDTLFSTETKIKHKSTIIDTVAETTTKSIQTIAENGLPSQYLSSSIIHENQNSPTYPSFTEIFSHTLKNTNTMPNKLYSEQNSDSTSKQLELTTSNQEKTTIEISFFDASTRSIPNSQELNTFTSKEIQSITADKIFESTQQVYDVQEIHTKTSDSSFDTFPEINSILATNIEHYLEEDFSFSNLLASDLIEVLKKNYDMNDCLKNCSGNGLCKLKDKSLFVCECFSNFAGSSCQINTLPCASNPCLNNATCVNNLANKTFICHCQQDNNGNYLYFGKNCQNKVDVCANETCSKNGVCYDVNDEAKCKCFSSYSGEKCQIESDETLEDDTVDDEGKESMLQPNYYLQNQVRNTTTTTSPPKRPIRTRKPPDRYGH
ncbi:protocadherin Fat 1 isoform X1 [Brachionus plicatilis]|uniref:Protocadherin Fat 1 isoform X1 n=1 Tax=Brachionus plicatilis TaxID=10195 RepID=A0A3M7R5R4_BRAPC|nr:protocadherin Fat 1 isoform X1 [Brachionus plicatilis]